MPTLPLAAAFAALLASAAAAQSEPAPPERPEASLPLALLGETPAYGSADTVWASIGAGYADDFSDAVDAYLWTTLSWFAADDVELAGEIGAWDNHQPGPDAQSLSLSAIVRWHFVNTGEWTLFGDVGIGALVSTDVVPEGGTGLNFLPRVGAGVTRSLGDRTRLLVGVRWHHISNARINGDLRNPSRDALMLSVGVVFAF